ncbi:BTB/POZ domain-containing protein 2-like [Saccostrea echinata]|uniref:BTB/POZ domain-containing protein 2-like n=1 Tax=Saccostrea echinata TaxID=191078 RepID=UPI002A8379F4|nr:BTB/POZ domain-containing protein 2-like [Saccostrea echinata]
MATSSWQDSLSLKDALLHMLKQEISCDVKFLVGENLDEVSCHSFVLIARSHVFEAMLMSPMTERDQEGRAIVSLPEVEVEIVQCFLRYLYTDDVKPTANNVMAILYLARKYIVQTLSDNCQTFITKANLMEAENAIEIYHQAFLFDLKDLMADSMKIINQGTEQCLQSDYFLTLPPECVRRIIADDHHHQVKEETIYRSVMRWCEEECKRRGLKENDEEIRKVLKDSGILYEIRFQNMDARFFQSSIEKRRILTEDEKREVRTPAWRDIGRTLSHRMFKHKPRNVCQRVMRMEECEEEMVLDDLEHIIVFESSVECVMHGIVTYGLSHESSKVTIYVKLIDQDDNTIVLEDFCFESDAETKHYEVKFQKAVEIQPDRQYRVCLTLGDTDWSWKGKNGHHSVPFKDGEVTFSDYGGGAIDTNMLEGQIPGLLLS